MLRILQVLPKGELVLAKVSEVEEKTTGGILLPGSAQKKPTSGDVVALGDGQAGGKKHEFELKVHFFLGPILQLGCDRVMVCTPDQVRN